MENRGYLQLSETLTHEHEMQTRWNSVGKAFRKKMTNSGLGFWTFLFSFVFIVWHLNWVLVKYWENVSKHILQIQLKITKKSA